MTGVECAVLRKTIDGVVLLPAVNLGYDLGRVLEEVLNSGVHQQFVEVTWVYINYDLCNLLRKKIKVH